MSELIKLFKNMNGYCVEIGYQLFSLPLRREQKENAFNINRRELGWIGKRCAKHWNSYCGISFSGDTWQQDRN